MMLSRFAQAYGIDLDEAEKPLGDYADFDELPADRALGHARSPTSQAESFRRPTESWSSAVRPPPES